MSSLSINHVCLAGHLTRDPVLRKTSGGASVVDLGLAINDEYTTRDGKVVEQTCFADCVVWGKSAEASSTYLKKGDPALVEGSLITEQWDTPQGEKRTRLRVRAIRVHFLRSRTNGSSGGEGAAVAAAVPATAAADGDDPFA
ncbi:MAG: single-stranded DNA-binding protein [bacterium]